MRLWCSTILLCWAETAILIGVPVRPASGDLDLRPIVVVRIDDCQTNWRTPLSYLGGKSALEYCKEKRIPITWAIISGRAHDPNLSLTWAELKDYLDTAGGEAASHSVTHKNLPAIDLIAEISQSKAMIESALPGYSCNTFLQPGTWQGDAYMDNFSELDNPIGQAIQSNYAQSMAYLGGGYPAGASWQVGEIYYRYGMCASSNIDYSSSVTPQSVLATLDAVAATPGLIYIVTGHGAQDAGGTIGGRIQADVLKAFVDRLAELRDQGKVRLMGIHDAYHTAFLPDLNHVTDPGFEVCNPGPLNPKGPWILQNGAILASSGGMDDSKYILLPYGNSSLSSATLQLAPGRYEMTWYQRAEPGSAPNKPVWLVMGNSGPYPPDGRNVIDWAGFFTATPGIWQQQSALFLIRDKLPRALIQFFQYPGGSTGLDNISIKSRPVDPGRSASGSNATVGCSECKVSWTTPNDPDVATIVVRYDGKTHPISPTSGTHFGSIAAIPGADQEITAPINWSSQRACVFFSIFAVKAGGEFAPPDLVYVQVDKTAPQKPQVTLHLPSNGVLQASWNASDPESGVMGYKYAVGKSWGGSDVIPWTETTNTSVTLDGLPVGINLYFSVKAKNSFCFWSESGSKNFVFPSADIRSALDCEDGTEVLVSGIVTAVFSDGCYIEQLDRLRGIKLIGSLNYREGDTATVSGTIATVNGERIVNVD